ncbi:MAG: hypothetical protein DI628_03980 [Blastochloris viridis]|uniref:Uncharacterized protein n=1 Tax=Blastochloris viridis TaxID=1079 RepID=A0A6N4R4W7_BLAVI|nr:MAG: hypothetical protein DI628_03980 [Blastochloris viridis]
MIIFTIAMTIMVVCFRILFWMLKKLFGKKRKRLPTGQYVVVYPDGRELVELKADYGPTRLVPNTPQLQEKLMNNKRQNRFLRLLRKP